MTGNGSKYVVVTGVSSGIGRATLAELAAHGYHVFGSVRTQEVADRLSQEYGAAFTPLLFDVTDEDAVDAAAEQVAEVVGDRGLVGLVNNAGIAVGGPLLYLPIKEMRRQFEVNLFGVMNVIQAFAPLLGAEAEAPHPPGRIINLSSASGHTAYPFLGPYAASKFALEGFSDSLRRELQLFGIDVIVIIPGAVRTPIWDKALALAEEDDYSDTEYAEIVPRVRETLARLEQEGMPPERVSRTIRQALESPRPKTRYVVANNWLLGWILPRWLPDRWLDRLVARQWGLGRA